MKTIQVLILRSKELQQEIVTEGAVSLHYSTMHTVCVCVCVLAIIILVLPNMVVFGAVILLREECPCCLLFCWYF